MPLRIPKTLRVHGLDFDVWQLGDGRFAFDCKHGGIRRVIKRRDFDDLRKEAERFALKIVNAETDAEDVTAAEKRLFVHSRDALAQHGMTLDAATRLLIEAAQHVGAMDRIIEACRAFGVAGPEVQAVPSAQVLDHFLRNLSADGLSAIYFTKMADDLKKFVAKFPAPLRETRCGDMEEWLRGMKVGLRRRRNLRDKLITLFNFARDQKPPGSDHEYLPSDLRTEAEKIRRPKITRKAPAIYTPEELDLILTQCAQPEDTKLGRHAYTQFIPPLCIGSFAGLRWAEILRLDWSQVHFADGVIEVGEENKTGYRLVPIENNLASWLAPYRDACGPVCRYKRPDHVLTSLRARAGLPSVPRRYQNAPRHSYVTYLVATTKNMPLVAGNSGHSVSELRRSYHRASLESAGKRWFDISRDSANVIQMPLGSFRLG